jgi:HEAT repeat protein
MAYDLESLRADLADKATSVRLAAAQGLEAAFHAELDEGRRDWAPLVADFLPLLIQGLGDPHKGVQVHSANCLEFLAYQSEAVVPALREALAGADRWQAWGAALVVARMGLWTPEIGPALAGAMGARDRDVRWAAASLTLKLARVHPSAIAMVKETLADPNPTARKMAAYCLGAVGAFAPVVDELAAALPDPEFDVRRAVILAIDKLPSVPESVQVAVAAFRRDPDLFVQRTAAAVAAKWGL